MLILRKAKERETGSGSQHLGNSKPKKHRQYIQYINKRCLAKHYATGTDECKAECMGIRELFLKKMGGYGLVKNSRQVHLQ